MNTDQHIDSVDIFGSLSLYYIIWLQPVIDSQGFLVLPEPMPQQMTVYHFSITPKIYFFFDSWLLKSPKFCNNFEGAYEKKKERGIN